MSKVDILASVRKELLFLADFSILFLKPVEDMSHLDTWGIRCAIRTDASGLSAEERNILKFRIGLAGRRPHTVAEVARKFSIPVDTVVDIQERALRAGRPGSSGEPPAAGAGVPRRPPPDAGEGHAMLREVEDDQ